MVMSCNETSSDGEDQEFKEHSEGEEDDDEEEEEQQQPANRQARTARTSNKWPTDKLTVTEIGPTGMPTTLREKRRLRKLAGLIARQRLSLVMPRFNSLSHAQKWELFNDYVTPFLEFSADMEPLGFRMVMKVTAKAWRTHKSSLVRNFIAKGVQPFKQHPYIEPEEWDEFVMLKGTEESKAESEKYKALRQKYVHDHNLGTAGYDGKIPRWETEDSDLSAQGIYNPWNDFPEGRPVHWLRARSYLDKSKGAAEIKWRKPATQKVSEDIKEKQALAESSGITWVREKDILSSCLGPEQPGRVRGLSSYMGWKHAWPECSDIYRKRKRIDEVDVQAITTQVTEQVRAQVTEEVRAQVTEEVRAQVIDQVKAEVTQDIMSMLASQGFQVQPISRNQQPFSRTPSPALGRRSSCASATEAGVGAEQIDLDVQHHADPMHMEMENQHEDLDSIDLLTGTTPCSLQAIHGGYQIEIARGRVFPHQTILHIVPVLYGHAVVQVEFVHPDFEDHVLPLPPNDETTKLGQALLQRVQWKRRQIVVNPTTMDGSSKSATLQSSKPLQPTTMDSTKRTKSSVGAANSAPIIPSKELGAYKSSNQAAFECTVENHQIVAQREQQPAKKGSITSVAEKPTKKLVAESGEGGHPTKKDNRTFAAEKTTKKIVAKSVSAENSTKKVVAESGQKKPATNSEKVAAASKPKKQPNIIVTKAWTLPNSEYIYGKPLLSAAKLLSAGRACASLHTYYMQGCGKKLDRIVVKFKRSHFLRSLDSECFIVSFAHLYDLFNFGALDTSLMRCITLLMVVDTMASTLPMGFLDPQMMALTTITTKQAEVVQYLTKALNTLLRRTASCLPTAKMVIGF